MEQTPNRKLVRLGMGLILAGPVLGILDNFIDSDFNVRLVILFVAAGLVTMGSFLVARGTGRNAHWCLLGLFCLPAFLFVVVTGDRLTRSDSHD